jgi:hypothetical protein
VVYCANHRAGQLGELVVPHSCNFKRNLRIVLHNYPMSRGGQVSPSAVISTVDHPLWSPFSESPRGRTLYSPAFVVQNWAVLRLRCSTISAINYGYRVIV